MMKQARNTHILSRQQGGFTLIEVLISMFILLIGLLGVAATQLVSFQNNQNAYMRSQATFIASDFLDRIRSNPAGRNAGHYNSITIDDAGDVPSAQTCISTAAGCNAENLAKHDIRSWSKHFYDLDSQTGYKPTVPAARATIARDLATEEFTVTVFWQEKDWMEDANSKAVRGDTVERFVQLRTIVQ